MKIKINKAQQKQHMRSSKTGKVYRAGQGYVKYDNEDELKGSEQYVNMYKDEAKEKGYYTACKKYQGGFSDDVIFNDEGVNYIREGKYVHGYFGASRRTKERDEILENELRSQGLDGSGIASWLSSGNARRLMDEVEKDTTIEQFKKIVKKDTKGAFEDVFVWSHPEHDGSWGSSDELKEKLYDYYKEKILKDLELEEDFKKQIDEFLTKEQKETLMKKINKITLRKYKDNFVEIKFNKGAVTIYPVGYKLTESDIVSLRIMGRNDSEFVETEATKRGWGSALRFKELGKDKE